MTIRRFGRQALLVGALAVTVGAAACSSGAGSSSSATTTPAMAVDATGPAELTAKLAAIEADPRYAKSDWGYVVLDQETGEVLASQAPERMFDAGSTMKTFAISSALKAWGPDKTFTTPIYEQGTRNGSTLDGNLVLVGSGDLTLGLRAEPDGGLSYENLPELNHSYATVGLPGAVEPKGDPLGVLDEMAAKVKAAGITEVNGDVVVDDRLFQPWKSPDGLVSPIWVNENLIDIEVTPGAAAGNATSIDWRPRTASYTVENQTTTVASDGNTALKVEEPTPGKLVITGTVQAGQSPTLAVKEIDDPAAFARTALIEALQKAGVTVTASPTGANPAGKLPAKDSYAAADKVTEHVSTDLAAYVKLIMKVSYNRGADLMACLAAVKAGSDDCEKGVAEMVNTAATLGVPKDSIFPFDGAGSNDQDRLTTMALATAYREAVGASYGKVLFDSLPILGKDGTLANVLTDSPAAGKVQMKTGNRVAGTPADQIIVLGNSLAGYIEAASGRKLTIAVAVGNVPIASTAEFEKVTADQAQMVVEVQQAF
jgi:D-alanyl-D-alanine carboxypeptidase/D-alanyl-D-alanine-endopeptidase (penicillin-binding protein 4)